MLSQFLSEQERNLIQRDFSDFLKSFETCDIKIHYKKAVVPVTNEVYNVTTATSWLDKFIPCRASQQIVSPVHENILAWGIVEAGDCIFYIDKTVDLSDIQYDSCYIEVKTGENNNVQWNPIPIKRREFIQYLGFRLGNDQVAQVIVCRMR